MTEMSKAVRRLRRPLAAVGAVWALSGCAATHVGEHWQCPLAQGTQCTTVAAVDPAVNRPADAERPARPSPLDRAQDAAGLPENAKTPRDCAGGCPPFAWLARLFCCGGDGSSGRGEPAVPTPGSAGQGASPVASPVALGDLRAPETVGRVWIAPYVDADGVYREASWVRIVIAPAAWKRP